MISADYDYKLEEDVQMMSYLLWILEHLSPWVQAPILKKKEQLTLSFSVPKILAKYSAIGTNVSVTLFKMMRGQVKTALSLSSIIN